jgi:hypothetical protein
MAAVFRAERAAQEAGNRTAAQSCASHVGRPAVLALAGLAALLLGAAIYALDRNPAHAMLMAALWPPAQVAQAPLFGWAGGWLPSLLHALAFGCLSATFLAPRSRGPYIACLAWAAANVAFEFGQHEALAARLVEWSAALGGDTLAGRALAAYFAQGRFDWQDVAAACAGSLLAMGLVGALDGSMGDQG